jgi:hypothetical protein
VGTRVKSSADRFVVSLRAVITAILIVATGLAANRASAWGFMSDINRPVGVNHLVHKVRRNHEIRFCLLNEDPNEFQDWSIAEQIRKALELWKKAFIDLSGDFSVTQLDCRNPNIDLKIHIHRADQIYLGLPARATMHHRGALAFAYIELNTAFEITSSDGLRYRVWDFGSLFSGQRQALIAAMESISFSNPRSVFTYVLDGNRRMGNLPLTSYPQKLHLSSYAQIIHELGHAFGLCDTYQNGYETCDPHFLTAPTASGQPDSVMKSANDYFYLTRDDVNGIRALFETFRD